MPEAGMRWSGRGRRAAGGDRRSSGGDTTAVPRIEVEALTKRFGSKTAVDAVDLVVEPGTFLVLLGPSGSGERRDLAMVFQDYALWPHLSAEDNVGFALKRRGLGSDERRIRARAMLDQVGLTGLHGRYPGQLSGGEQQRVALARALVGRPGLLLFDEPLSNLDADRRERLRVDIGSMVREQGATAVYITHDQSEAFALADVIGVLRSGRLVQIGPPEEIYRSPADDFVARFTGLAGELPGRVVCGPGDEEPESLGESWLSVDVGGAVIRGHRIGAFGLRSGQPVRVLVRPSALRFAGSAGSGRTEGWRHPGPPGAPTSAIPVVIRDAAFRGWGYEHLVEVPGGHRLAGVPAGTRLPFGASAQVELSADGCLVAPDPTGAGARRGEPAAKPGPVAAPGLSSTSPAGRAPQPA